jgi:hypothetical protein
MNAEIRKHASWVTWVALVLGMLAFLAGWTVVSALMLGTSLVAWRVSDERATAQDLDEIEKFANKKDNR